MVVSETIQAYYNDQLLGKLLLADLNITSDQAITISGGNKLITKILVVNPSGGVNIAAGGIYTAVSKGGVQIVASTQVYATLGANLSLSLTLAKDYTNLNTLYLSLTTGQGGACTVDIYVYGKIL